MQNDRNDVFHIGFVIFSVVCITYFFSLIAKRLVKGGIEL